MEDAFICTLCGRAFLTTVSQEEAGRECLELFAFVPSDAERADVCEECFALVMARVRALRN